MQFNFLFRLMDPNASLLFIIFHSDLKMVQKRNRYKNFFIKVFVIVLKKALSCKF